MAPDGPHAMSSPLPPPSHFLKSSPSPNPPTSVYMGENPRLFVLSFPLFRFPRDGGDIWFVVVCCKFEVPIYIPFIHPPPPFLTLLRCRPDTHQKLCFQAEA